MSGDHRWRTIALTNLDMSEHNFPFGPRVSFSAGRFRPFAHVLFGASHININGFESDTSFGSAYGGGLDYRVKGRFTGDSKAITCKRAFSVKRKMISVSRPASCFTSELGLRLAHGRAVEFSYSKYDYGPILRLEALWAHVRYSMTSGSS